jgi:hypothetical protein
MVLDDVSDLRGIEYTTHQLLPGVEDEHDGGVVGGDVWG